MVVVVVVMVVVNVEGMTLYSKKKKGRRRGVSVCVFIVFVVFHPKRETRKRVG